MEAAGTAKSGSEVAAELEVELEAVGAPTRPGREVVAEFEVWVVPEADGDAVGAGLEADVDAEPLMEWEAEAVSFTKVGKGGCTAIR